MGAFAEGDAVPGLVLHLCASGADITEGDYFSNYAKDGLLYSASDVTPDNERGPEAKRRPRTVTMTAPVIAHSADARRPWPP